MARSLQQIQNEILSSIASDDILNALLNTSKTSRYNVLVYVIALAIYTHEKIFDQHVIEVDDQIEKGKHGGLPWYAQKALQFQLGFNLHPDTDIFDNTGATENEIQESKIVKYASATEPFSESKIILKIATEENGLLKPVSQTEKQSFESYLDEYRIAGTDVTVINQEADLLMPTIDIYRDPLIIDESGISIRTGLNTVEITIKEYLRELDFNGELSVQKLVDQIQLIDGVLDINVVNMETAPYNSIDEQYETLQPINVRHIPVSGHYIVNDFSRVQYVV